MTENNNISVYNSPDEIPLYEKQHVKPIDFDGLPNFNVIRMFINYIMCVKDSYPEFAWQNGLSMLSTLVRRRLFTKMNGELIYLNLWTLSLGLSGYARKSGAIGIGKRIVGNAIEHTFLPEDTTPEGLIEAMASRLLIPRVRKDGTSTVERIDRDLQGNIPSSQMALWKDEAGQMYAAMGKAHMQGMGELFCKLHGCPSEYYKKLTSKSIVIENAYFTMNLATTPASFLKHANSGDIDTGFIARHLIVAPSYIKDRKPLKEDSERDNAVEQVITKALKTIDGILPDNELKFQFQEGVLDLIDRWAAEHEEFFARTKDEKMSSFFAKYQMDTVRIAALIELGNIPYYLAMNKRDSEEVHIQGKFKDESTNYLDIIKDLPENINYELTKLNISLASMLFALKTMDSVYLPHVANLDFIDGKASFQNDVQKFYALMERVKKMNRSSMVKKFSQSRLEEITYDAVAEGHIEVCQVATATKPQFWFVYKPTDTTNFKLKADYSNVVIDEFEPDIKMKFKAPKEVMESIIVNMGKTVHDGLPDW